MIPSRYSSLPNSSPPRIHVLPKQDSETGLTGGRTVLGVNISAVRDAVLRGVPRIPGIVHKTKQKPLNKLFFITHTQLNHLKFLHHPLRSNSQ